MKYLLRNDVGMQRSGGNGGVPYFGRSLVTAKIGRDENLQALEEQIRRIFL